MSDADLRELHRWATTDGLTGVANRHVFVHLLEQAMRRIDASTGGVAVALVDLDRFKQINDAHGHLTGDVVLAAAAGRLRALLRPSDALARMGGDEFALVVEGVGSPDDAARLGKRIVDAGRSPFDVEGRQFLCTFSVGITVTTDPRRSADGLLAEADLALYRAKDHGRDRFELFDDDLRVREVGRLGIEQMLRRALQLGWLRLAYQPVVDLRSGATVCAEALVRVHDPGHPTLVPAEQFITVARSSGLLGEIDAWMVAQVAKQASRWDRRYRDSGFGGTSLNVTARHLDDPTFVRAVITAVQRSAVRRGLVQVEVTEADLLAASPATIDALAALHAAGVSIGLDNFGSGPTSLTALRVFPLDVVKLDRSLVHEAAGGGSGAAVAASIVGLCHALGMTVVAEGIETAAQLNWALDVGCERAQGHLFAPAGPRHLVDERLRRERATPGAISSGDAHGGHVPWADAPRPVPR